MMPIPDVPARRTMSLTTAAAPLGAQRLSLPTPDGKSAVQARGEASLVGTRQLAPSVEHARQEGHG
jgi:hypothetical protein